MLRTTVLRRCAAAALAGFVSLSAVSAFGQAAITEDERADREVIRTINEIIAQGWADAEIAPSAKATDGEWVRRVYLDILGRIPTADEALEFDADRSSDKKAKLVDKLLYSDEFIEEYARNWTTQWSNILIGRSGGGEESLADREGLQQYLRRGFLRNIPHDKMVMELVTATGNSTPGEEGYNGAVNFLLNEIDLAVPPNERTARVTAKVCKIFLGLQVQCTQCHNHPFNDWKQNQFWSMDSFFRQMQQERNGRTGPSRLFDKSFAGETGNIAEADIFYELRNGLLKVAYPVFVDGSEINRSGDIAEVNRRQELGKLIVNSTYMRKAAVNRMWGHFLGYGFTKPVDDMGPHNPASHPKLLTELGEAFAYHRYDNKRLIKWITLSEPYSLSSRFSPSNTRDDPTLGEPPLFSRFYLRQMTAEELFESLLVATEAHKRGDQAAQKEAKERWLATIVTNFDTDEGGETTTFNGTIPQALTMMNSDLTKNALSTEGGTFLNKLATADLKPEKKLERLFLAGLARKPNRDETLYAMNLWAARKGNTTEALKDVFWAILNSNEFILNH